MAHVTLKSIVLGFVAGAIAAVTAHELINYVLLQQSFEVATSPWSTDPVPIQFGAENIAEVPRIASVAFWGGVWGIVFALILGSVPKGSMTVKGLILGLVVTGIIGTFVIEPMIYGEEIFMGGNQAAMGSILLMTAGFGAVTAWLYGFLTSGCRLP